eukprot:349894-Chlamydomonas_euryale.AAC.12
MPLAAPLQQRHALKQMLGALPGALLSHGSKQIKRPLEFQGSVGAGHTSEEALTLATPRRGRPRAPPCR